MRTNLWPALAGLALLLSIVACGATAPAVDPPVERTPQPTPRALLATPEPRERGSVLEPVDGETLLLALGSSEVPIRLLAIETPDPALNDCFAGGAASFVAAVAPPGATVELEQGVAELDRSSPLPRYVFFPDGSMLNEQLVRGGFARVADHEDGKYLERLQDAEDAARRDGLGVWADCPAATPVAVVAAPTAEPTPPASAVIAGPPAPTATQTPTPIPTALPTVAPTPAPTEAATITPSPIATPPPTATAAPTATATATATASPTAAPTAPPTPAPTAAPPPAQSCDPSYPSVCIPPKSEVGDLNCGDIPHRRFAVLPPDPHGFDRDKDGVGCES